MARRLTGLYCLEWVAKLSIVQPEIMMGLLFGGSVIYWFSGASTQAVVTGAYRAVVFIKENIKQAFEAFEDNDRDGEEDD